MGSLIFICPTSSQEVSTGLEMDLASFKALPLIAEIKCPACGLTHNLFQVGARLTNTGRSLAMLAPQLPKRHRKRGGPRLRLQVVSNQSCRPIRDPEVCEATFHITHPRLLST